MINFDNEFENAVRFLTLAMPSAEELEKPTLFHSMRVGIYLYSHNYSSEISIAGLLHDALEDTEITQDQIEEKFGKEVADIVVANTKDNSLHGDEKWEGLLQQCFSYGEDALIVKAADIIDNHIYYSRIQEPRGLEYTNQITTLLLKNKPQEYEDKVFTELDSIVNPSIG